MQNHFKENIEFTLPRAVIEHAKALANDKVISNPVANASELTPFQITGFRGRPLQGEYVLKIWDMPQLVWSNLEDV